MGRDNICARRALFEKDYEVTIGQVRLKEVAVEQMHLSIERYTSTGVLQMISSYGVPVVVKHDIQGQISAKENERPEVSELHALSGQ